MFSRDGTEVVRGWKIFLTRKTCEYSQTYLKLILGGKESAPLHKFYAGEGSLRKGLLVFNPE